MIFFFIIFPTQPLESLCHSGPILYIIVTLIDATEVWENLNIVLFPVKQPDNNCGFPLDLFGSWKEVSKMSNYYNDWIIVM